VGAWLSGRGRDGPWVAGHMWSQVDTFSMFSGVMSHWETVPYPLPRRPPIDGTCLRVSSSVVMSAIALHCHPAATIVGIGVSRARYRPFRPPMWAGSFVEYPRPRISSCFWKSRSTSGSPGVGVLSRSMGCPVVVAQCHVSSVTQRANSGVSHSCGVAVLSPPSVVEGRGWCVLRWRITDVVMPSREIRNTG
jgi:hypothetical protein